MATRRWTRQSYASIQIRLVKLGAKQKHQKRCCETESSVRGNRETLIRMKRWSLPLSALAVVLIVTACGGASPAAVVQTGLAELSLGVIAAPNVICNPVEKPDTCTVEIVTQFTLTADIDALPISGFSGFQIDVVHTGLISEDIRYVVPEFETFSFVETDGFLAGGVTSFSRPIPTSTYLGRLVEADLNCSASPGTFEISLPVPTTDVLDEFANSISITTVQQGQRKLAATLTINCADEL